MLTDEAAQFAGQEALLFFEVSAKDGTDVKLLFSQVCAELSLSSVVYSKHLVLPFTAPYT